MAASSAKMNENYDDTDEKVKLDEKSVKALITKGKERGYLTYEELNKALPQDQLSSEQIEDIMAMISDMGINVVESGDSEDDEDSKGTTSKEKAQKKEKAGVIHKFSTQ